jgi:hypothetical protein
MKKWQVGLSRINLRGIKRCSRETALKTMWLLLKVLLILLNYTICQFNNSYLVELFNSTDILGLLGGIYLLLIIL